jgi:hypothetical protein
MLVFFKFLFVFIYMEFFFLIFSFIIEIYRIILYKYSIRNRRSNIHKRRILKEIGSFNKKNLNETFNINFFLFYLYFFLNLLEIFTIF